jgi:hypothetical protein
MTNISNWVKLNDVMQIIDLSVLLTLIGVKFTLEWYFHVN